MKRRSARVILGLFDADRKEVDISYAVYRVQEIEPTVSGDTAREIVFGLVKNNKLQLSDGWKLTLPA